MWLRHLLGCGVVVALLAAFAVGCAENPVTVRDGAVDGGRRDGAVPRPTGPCGVAGAACCSGRVCELGLGCGSGDVCCVQAGGGARCDSASDCCRGLACQGGGCCAPRAAACTGSSDCCTGLVCHEGVCASPEQDLPPGSEGCGGAAGRCCPGFTCRSGLVCTEGTCASCGDRGQACCDGATACLGSLACDVTAGECVSVDPATACGEIDNACCPNAAGVPTDCAGDLVCRGGRCLDDEDSGFMGAPCTARGNCDPGLVCDRTSDPNGLCTMPPSNCGRDGQSCCELGGSDAECTGSFYCQFGECSECRGPSLTCLLGGILPGQRCCGGSVCRPAPLLPRCCMGPGARCTNSLDCCGLMYCGADGTCQCNREGSFCLDSSECCDGFACRNFQCRAVGGEPMCMDTQTRCESSGTCCDGLACSERREDPTSRPVRECCAAGSAACERNEDCCGSMNCADGECQCIGVRGLCDRDLECCDVDGVDHICVLGSCAVGENCARDGQTCSDTGAPGEAPRCCGTMRCESLRAGIDRPRRCCGDIGERCLDDDDCCGATTCGDNQLCACVPAGGGCETFNTECCPGLSCTETTPGSGAYRCM